MRLIAILILLNFGLLLNAGPANNTPFKYIQPDGTEIILKAFGDEWVNYVQTLDGYTVLKSKSNYYVYAESDRNGNLVESQVPVSPTEARTQNELIYLSSVKKGLKPGRVNNRFDSNNQSGTIKLNKQFKTTWNILVILIEYPDLPHMETVQSFDAMFNEEGWEGGIGSTGSFNDYFKEVSYGNFEITADVVGWFTAPQSYLYYSWQDPSVCWKHAQELTKSAVEAAEASGVDFSKYDNDNDGWVEQVLIVHSGLGAAQNGDLQYVWPHKFNLENAITYDGVKVFDYTMQEELYKESQYNRHAGIGMYAHEFGHALGLPDLYDYDDGENASEGIGKWCEMSGGAWLNAGRTPSHFSAWCKKKLGWSLPINASSSGEYEIKNSTQNSDGIYLVDIPTLGSEYFLLENRRRVGWDSYLPGDGLLIWHIDESVMNNNNQYHKLVDLEEADGTNDLDHNRNRGDSGDPFPGSTNNRTFNSYSNPNSRDYNNQQTVVSISEISNAAVVMSAYINIDLYAKIGADVTSGHAPLAVNFRDESESITPVTSWQWDFNEDGVIDSYEENPIYVYESPGDYNVEMTIFNGVTTQSVSLENTIRVFSGNSALSFESGSSVAAIQGRTSINLTTNNTIEFWMYPTDWGIDDSLGLGSILNKEVFVLALQKKASSVFMRNSLSLILRDNQNNLSYHTIEANSIELNTWQHIAIVTEGGSGSIKVFVNGDEKTVTSLGNFSGGFKDNSQSNILIGNSKTFDRPFEGFFDELRIWNVSRSEYEIKENMNKYLSGNEQGLIGYWPMDDGGGNLFVDKSFNGNNGSTTSLWRVGKSLSGGAVGTDEAEILPKSFSLEQNYPNPFNPLSKIRYSVSHPGHVKLVVYDLTGREIQQLVNEYKPAGTFETEFVCAGCASGVYIYTLRSGKYFASRKMILLK